MFVHSSRIKKQLEHLQSSGIDISPVYTIADFSMDEVNDMDKMFSFEQFHLVLKFALEKTGDDFYGLKMGMQPHIAGTIGMMCASCKDLKEAFVQGCKFFKVQGNFADISFNDDEKFPKIVYRITNAWQFQYPETARQEVEAMFSFLTVIMKVNSNETIKPHKINLSYPSPSDTSEYINFWGLVPGFEKEENELIFNQKDLKIPMKAFNPETFQILKAHVEKRLKKFNNEESIVEKVKSILLSSLQYQFPDIETVAAKLNISARTLQRQLSNENTSFKTISQDLRFDLAKHLLSGDKLTVSEVSFTLGYSDLGNFSRSFKKFTGLSPQEYRMSHSSSN